MSRDKPHCQRSLLGVRDFDARVNVRRAGCRSTCYARRVVGTKTSPLGRGQPRLVRIWCGPYRKLGVEPHEIRSVDASCGGEATPMAVLVLERDGWTWDVVLLPFGSLINEE